MGTRLTVFSEAKGLIPGTIIATSGFGSISSGRKNYNELQQSGIFLVLGELVTHINSESPWGKEPKPSLYFTSDCPSLCARPLFRWFHQSYSKLTGMIVP